MRVSSPRRKRSNRLTDKTLVPGDSVVVFNIELASAPFIEGQAEIIHAIENCPGFYLVRFDGEATMHIRLVLDGGWQHEPEFLLEQLKRVFLASLMPDADDNFPSTPCS